MRSRIPNDKRRVITKCALLVENHALLRTVLTMRLDQEPDFEATALCPSQLKRSNVDFSKCDVAIIDLHVPNGNGTGLIRELHDTLPRDIPVLALTESRDPEVHAQASRAGASEVLTMDVGFGAIMEALRRALGEA